MKEKNKSLKTILINCWSIQKLSSNCLR